MPNELVAQLDLMTHTYVESMPDSETANAFRATVQAHVRPLVLKHAEREAALRSDTGLNRLGFEQRLDAAIQETEQAAATWHQEIDATLEAEIAAKEIALASIGADVPDVPAPTELELGALEAALRALDVTQRNSAYASADPRKRRAMEVLAERIGTVLVVRKNGDPAWEPFLDEERIKSFRQSRIESENPAAVRELHRLRQLRAGYRAVAGTVRTNIRSKRH